MDDAYIFYCYVANFVQGEGLVYNSGGPLVEGFTSFVWYLLLVLGALIFGVELFFDLGLSLGLLFYFGCLLLIGFMVRDGVRCWLLGVILFFMLFVFLSFVSFYVVVGMEVLLFVVIVLCVVGVVLVWLLFFIGVVVCVLVLWVCFEGGWFFIMVGAQLVGAGRIGVFRELLICRFLVVFIFGGLVLVLVRGVIFGEVFSNIFYVKIFMLVDGLRYVSIELL